MASDTKKNKGVSKKEKHKNEEKIDPNDLVVKLTGKQKIYPVKGRRENAIPQTGKVCLPVVGVKNIKKRPTTDHLPHIKEKAKSVGGTNAMSACTYDQPKKLQDSSRKSIEPTCHRKRKLFPHGYLDLFRTLEVQIHGYDLHLGLADTKKTFEINVSVFSMDITSTVNQIMIDREYDFRFFFNYSNLY